MIIKELNQRYKELIKLPNYSFKQKQEFLKLLVQSQDKNIFEYHYGILKKSLKNSQRKNKTMQDVELYHSLRSAFTNYEKELVEKFLLKRLKIEKNTHLQADILQLLGHIKSDRALPIALDFLKHSNPDHRYRGSIVIGWVGGDNELPLLKKILLTDKNAHVRTDTAAALSQIFFRLPELKEKISIILQEALKQERDEEAQRSIISSLQDVLSQKFGLRFNYEEGEIVGNTANALKKAYSYLGIK